MSKVQHSVPLKVPLCIDLDGTLVNTDTLWESFLLLCKKNPFSAFLSLFTIFKGKQFFKAELAEKVAFDPANLPYNHRFIEYLKAEKQRGRRLILITGSHQSIAQAVADHLKIFDEVHGSNLHSNLIGVSKEAYLVNLIGEKEFLYAGNSKDDLKVWRSSYGGIAVNTPPRLLVKAKSACSILHEFSSQANPLLSVFKAMRVYQWVKNILIFLPLLAAHKVDQIDLVIKLGFAFLAFSLCASSVYLLNDLLDLSADRKHPLKRRRPFAAGTLSIKFGVLFSPILLGLGLSIAFNISLSFGLMILGYYGFTCAYSFKLKELLLIDVLVLTILYNWRVLSGALATEISLSPWLLGFVSFLFYSLAFAKRSSELQLMLKHKKKKPGGRSYIIDDLNLINMLGSGSGLLAVLILALYINSSKIQLLYSHPFLLWPVCFAMLYWISRVWLLTGRGKMHQDPIVFALKDPSSYVVGFFTLVLAILAV
ncbi:MAG: UbiA family prenyltransferase [Oligoflexales bacterium]|nr:UbiA family prenyltransferase [Oligoflexales bacterium]